MDALELQIKEVSETEKKHLCPVEEERSVDDDYAYALKLQKELNSDVKGSDGHARKSKTSVAAAEVEDQLKIYRETQKEKFVTCAGRGDKSSRGLDFRRNVAAIACGKPLQIGVANPISRSELSQKKQDSPKDLSDISSPRKRIRRDGKNLDYSPKKPGFHREDVFVIRWEERSEKSIVIPVIFLCLFVCLYFLFFFWHEPPNFLQFKSVEKYPEARSIPQWIVGVGNYSVIGFSQAHQQRLQFGETSKACIFALMFQGWWWWWRT